METKNDINCRKVISSHDPVMKKVEMTYNDSFPIEERRPFPLIEQLVNEEDKFRLYVIGRDNAYAGFITLWLFDDFAYIEHFAIDSSARNGGIGAITINLIKTVVEKPIVLEVELPEDDFSKRRIGFYERLGFVLDRHVYFQPPYHEGAGEIEMRLMSTEEYVTDESFEKVKSILYNYVYRVG